MWRMSVFESILPCRQLDSDFVWQNQYLTGLTTGSITGVLNRLERYGYARRVCNPKDRRNINGEAVDVAAFNERMEGFLGPLRKRMRALSSKYSSEETALIHDFIKRAVAISRDETLRL
jgi:hypothetical protein